MLRDYELMYIVRPDLEDEALAAAVESVDELITTQGGEVLESQSLGKRRLAYEIAKLRDGNYYVLHIRLDSDRVTRVERALSIHETVFRHMLTIYVEDKQAQQRGEGHGEGRGENRSDERGGGARTRGDRGPGVSPNGTEAAAAAAADDGAQGEVAPVGAPPSEPAEGDGAPLGAAADDDAEGAGAAPAEQEDE